MRTYRRQKFFTPSTLTSISIDAILEHFIEMEGIPEFGNYLDNMVSQLPKSLQERILFESEHFMDCPQKVGTLLPLWVSCTRPPFSPGHVIKTPRYLYNNKNGRMAVLKHLSQVLTTSQSSTVSLNMYSFYRNSTFSHHRQEVNNHPDTATAYAGFLLDTDEHFRLCRTLELMNHVDAIVLPTVCDNATLFVIATNCPRLSFLDVSMSGNVSDVGISAAFGSELCVCTCLQQVYLEGTSVGISSILVLLKTQPHLEVLESMHLNEALKYLSRNPLPQVTGLPLKNFVSTRQRNASPYNFDRFADLCPDMETIVLSDFRRELQLSELTKLSKLSSLHLAEVPVNIMLSALEKTGSSLTALRYTNFREFVNLDNVLAYCPKLEKIGISVGCLVKHSHSEVTWPNLKNVHLNVHALVSKPIWEKLFKQCSRLQYLDMTPADGMTDASIEQICNNNPDCLKNLKHFVIRGRYIGGDVLLTEETIQLLVMRCEALTIVGNCATWSVTSESHCDEFVYFNQ